MSEPDRHGQHSPFTPGEAHDLIPMSAVGMPQPIGAQTGQTAAAAPGIDQCRAEGLKLAVQLLAAEEHDPGERDHLAERVIETAGRFSCWLLARPHRLRLIPSRFTFEQGSPGPGQPTTTTGDDGMSVSMSDTQEVTYAVEAEDSKGFQVADTLTWSSDDAGAVVTVTPAADGMSCVFAAVAPGTATISVTDGTLSASDLITVTPGAVASLVLTPGAVTDQPAPAPAGS